MISRVQLNIPRTSHIRMSSKQKNNTGIAYEGFFLLFSMKRRNILMVPFSIDLDLVAIILTSLDGLELKRFVYIRLLFIFCWQPYGIMGIPRTTLQYMIWFIATLVLKALAALNMVSHIDPFKIGFFCHLDLSEHRIGS